MRPAPGRLEAEVAAQHMLAGRHSGGRRGGSKGAGKGKGAREGHGDSGSQGLESGGTALPHGGLRPGMHSPGLIFQASTVFGSEALDEYLCHLVPWLPHLSNGCKNDHASSILDPWALHRAAGWGHWPLLQKNMKCRG